MLRRSIVSVICLFGLSGCLHYANNREQITPEDAISLQKHHFYPIPQKKQQTIVQSRWWQRFNDPQLDQLITTALADAPDVQIAKSRIFKAQQLANEANSFLWPSIDFSGSVSRQRFAQYGLVPPPFNGKVFNIETAGFNFNYEFDFWGKNRAILASRLNQVCAAEADRAAAQLIISAAVAETYFRLMESQAQVHIAMQLMKERQETFDIIQDRLKHAIDSDIPVKNAQADLQMAALQVTQYEQIAALARHQLAELLGKNALTTHIEVGGYVYPKAAMRIPAFMSVNILAKRPDIAAAKWRAEAAANEVQVAKTLFLPNINLNALFSYQTVKFGHFLDPGSQANAIGGAIDLPIFDAGARKANLGARYAEYDVAVASYNQTIMTALKEVADQLSIMKSLNSQVATQSRVYSATNRTYQLTKMRYQHGIVDYVQVLQANEANLQQKSIRITYETKQVLALIGMIKAVGGDYRNDSAVQKG